MKHFWMALSISCLSAAAMALWKQRVDLAFVIATIGALAWFLNYRVHMKELLVESDRSKNEDPASNQDEN
jgi:hypothetical protein